MIHLVIGPHRSGKSEMGLLLFYGMGRAPQEGYEPLLIDASDVTNITYINGQWKGKWWAVPLSTSQEGALEMAKTNRPVVWVASTNGFYPDTYHQIIRCEMNPDWIAGATREAQS